MKVCIINSGSTVLTIPRAIALNNYMEVNNFIELGNEIKEHKYLQKIDNMNVHFFSTTRLTAYKLSKKLKQLEKDVYIVFFSAGTALISSILANDRPVVAICMGSDVLHLENKFSLFFKRNFWRDSDILIAKSKNLKKSLLRYNNKLVVDVNYWGIDKSFFKNIKKQEARTLLNLPSKYIILSPRTFSSLYNINLIIDTFISYKKKNNNAFLLLIGRISDKVFFSAMKEKFKKNNLVEGIDYRIDGHIEYNKISRYYFASDVALSFASTEGFPTTLFELFKCKCPAIVGYIPSLKDEIINHNKEVLFSKFDINDISENLHKIYSDQEIRNTLIKNGLKSYNEFGIIENNAKKLSLVINSLVHKNSLATYYKNIFIYLLEVLYNKFNKKK